MEENTNLTNGSRTTRPESYLVWSILSTVLCCLPFGIAAIVYSTKVDSLWDRGDRTGAEEASKKAKMWMLIAVGCGLLSIIVSIILMAFGVFAAITEEMY